MENTDERKKNPEKQETHPAMGDCASFREYDEEQQARSKKKREQPAGPV